MYHVREVADEPAELLHALRTGVPRQLRCAKIKLTSRCNLRCRMCRYWRTRDEASLSTGQWRGVLDQLRDLGCLKVHFSGGEVFLRADFLDLVEHASGLGMKVTLTTNATLLTPERIRRLVRARPSGVSSSLDGPRARIHDAVRGIPGSFRRTVRALRRLIEEARRRGQGPRVRLNFVLMQQNYRHLPEMLELAAELGVAEVNPMPVDEKGERRNRLSRAQIRRYNREVAPRVLALRQRHGFSTAPERVYPFGVTEEEIRGSARGLYARGAYSDKPCLAPWMHLFLAWDGEAYLCCMTNQRMASLGNAARESLEDIFLGPKMQAIRREFLAGSPHPACARCDMFLVENRLLHQALESFDREFSQGTRPSGQTSTPQQ